MSRSRLICICGPTASGKTATSIELAEFFNTEILSADSRQVYREMAIGTAVPGTDQLNRIKHHFIQDRSISNPFTAGMFEAEALSLLDTLFAKHEFVIVCGGTGLFLKALIEGLDDLPSANVELRAELQALYNSKGLPELLKRYDRTADSDAIIDRNNPRRIMRAIEIQEGKQSNLKTDRRVSRSFDVVGFVLSWPREELYKRINERVDEMMVSGLEAEARGLYPHRKLNALQTLGYTELFNYFDGNTTREECMEQIKTNTRRYAKRQLTWFRNQTNFEWVEQPFTSNILQNLGV